MEDFETLKYDEELNNILDSVNHINQEYLLACHGRYHTMFVVDTIESILTGLGFDQQIVELGKIAGLLHDIGTVYGKKGHAQKSSEMCVYFLDKTKLTQDKKDIIIHAIADHSNGNDINSPIGAALLIADKIDISKDRVLELGKQEPWHNNILNIEKTVLTIEDNNIIINYVVNDKFSQEIWESGWKKGVTVPIKASKYFGYNCIFKINGNTIELN